MDVPYITIYFSYCENNGWSIFNISNSCVVAPPEINYPSKIKSVIKQANELLEKLISLYPNNSFTCVGYEMVGVIDQQDYAPWLCEKLSPIIDFVNQLDC